MKSNYVDADVEEPNGFIFLKPKIETTSKVEVDIPTIDIKKCEKCYKCIDFCEFNALAIGRDTILVLDKLCHSCGGCKIVCDYGAITYTKKTIGFIEQGVCRDIKCQRGVLNIGELIASSILNKLLTNLDTGINIIDSAPGTSCNVINTLNYANYAIIVTEPTQFGLHDLKRVIALVKKLNIPFGIVINKVIKKDNIIKEYCNNKDIKILGEISYDIEIAKLYSRGHLLIDNHNYLQMFSTLSSNLKEQLLCK